MTCFQRYSGGLSQHCKKRREKDWKGGNKPNSFTDYMIFTYEIQEHLQINY